MECGGNLFDAVSLAVKSALHATEIPTVKVAAMDGNEPELELSDDPFDTKRLDTQNAPCVVTLMKVYNFPANTYLKLLIQFVSLDRQSLSCRSNA